jgi:hypothetical protein
VLEAGRAPAELLRTASGDPKAARDRLDRLLLAGYVPAATKLTVRPSRWVASRREKHYNAAQVTGWLHHLAMHLAWQGDQIDRSERHPPPGLSRIDIVPHLLWPIAGWRRVRYLHILLGGLGAMVGMLALAWILVGPPAVWTDIIGGIVQYGVVAEIEYINEVASSSAVILVASMVAFLILVTIWAGKACSVPWPRPDIVTDGTKVPARDRLSIRLLFLLAVMLAIWLISGRQSPLGSTIVFWTAAILLVIFLFWHRGAAVVSLRGRLRVGHRANWSQDAEAAAPGAALRADLMDGLIGGVILGAFLGLMSILSFPDGIMGTRVEFNGNSLWNLVIGLVAGIILGLVVWNVPLGRYVLGVSLARAQGRLPLRLGRFLDWACDAGLLRIAGAGYQFRHQELQHWLTIVPRLGSNRPPGGDQPAPYSKTAGSPTSQKL